MEGEWRGCGRVGRSGVPGVSDVLEMTTASDELPSLDSSEPKTACTQQSIDRLIN